jgi:hypothetical protein
MVVRDLLRRFHGPFVLPVRRDPGRPESVVPDRLMSAAVAHRWTIQLASCCHMAFSVGCDGFAVPPCGIGKPSRTVSDAGCGDAVELKLHEKGAKEEDFGDRSRAEVPLSPQSGTAFDENHSFGSNALAVE